MAHRSTTEIFNGANCKTYRWSQTHSDLEVRVELESPVRYKDLRVDITSDHLKVDLVTCLDTADKLLASKAKSRTLVEGDFEDFVNPESVCWLLDTEKNPCLLLYVDKTTGKWWNRLLKNEEATEKGHVEHVIDMEDLAEDSRMVIERLINEQKSKLDLQNHDEFSLV